jgi:predicted CXXCH cytochrome family protein
MNRTDPASITRAHEPGPEPDHMSKSLAPLIAACAVALFGLARAEASRLAPIPKAEAVSTHSPFETGACETCHQRHDPNDPGAAVKVSNDLCYDCHDEFRGKSPVKMDKSVHPSTVAACTTCHNPHNSKKKKLRL